MSTKSVWERTKESLVLLFQVHSRRRPLCSCFDCPRETWYGERGPCTLLASAVPSQFSLPAFVVKVAARRRLENLAPSREVWFYEEMENIQGVSIL